MQSTQPGWGQSRGCGLPAAFPESALPAANLTPGVGHALTFMELLEWGEWPRLPDRAFSVLFPSPAGPCSPGQSCVQGAAWFWEYQGYAMPCA